MKTQGLTANEWTELEQILDKANFLQLSRIRIHIEMRIEKKLQQGNIYGC